MSKIHDGPREKADTNLKVDELPPTEVLTDDQITTFRANLLVHSNQLMDTLVGLAGFALTSLGVTTFLMSTIGTYQALITASFYMHFIWLAGLTIHMMLTNDYICGLYKKAKRNHIRGT
ncbi:UNVERIFIED_CONTAM: hypothetical protein HDU68_008831, partial [Siphonaria sp. JEL0065]